MDLVFSVDAIALPSTFWSRLCSVAPKLELGINHVQPENTEVKSIDSPTDRYRLKPFQHRTTRTTTLIHLVSLSLALDLPTPSWLAGCFNGSAWGLIWPPWNPLQQWRTLDEAHRVYEAVESDITATIDAVRYMEAQRDKRAQQTEREVYNYRLMSLSNTAATVEELERLMSSR